MIQAFADEQSRVFAAAHPAVALLPINMTEAVSQMAKNARRHGRLIVKAHIA